LADALETIHTLRSTHGGFSPDREIPESDLRTILGASVRAATASHRQSYSIVVVRDKETMGKVSDYVASACLVYCVDFTRLTDLAGRLGEQFYGGGLLLFLAGWADALLAAQNAAISARALGIDSLFTNSVHRHPLAEIYAALDLPEQRCFPAIALLLGYDTRPSPHKTGRLGGPGVVHYERYSRMDEGSMADMIAQYDNPESGLQLTAGWRDQGFQHYLNWYFQRGARRPNAAKNQEIYEHLARAGFLPAAERPA
jgi:nitroreductase